MAPAISPAAKHWAGLWRELDVTGGRLLARAPHVRADRFGPAMELIPQLLDLRQGRRFIAIGIKYDTGPGRHRSLGSVAFGQFLNLAFADWEIAHRVWELLQTGERGVAFEDLEIIDGNFDQATKASDQYHKDRWTQRVWELKVELERQAARRTQAVLDRIAEEVRARQGESTSQMREGIELPASLLGPDEATEAVTRFRINQGLYGDHVVFIERPVEGRMTVYGIPPERMFARAAEIRGKLVERWLSGMAASLDELVGLTGKREGAALARAVESAEVVRKLNDIVEAFWQMWRSPLFSAHAEFEVVDDPGRRAEKYMELIIQRSLRLLLKSAVESIGLYPYPAIDRFNYWNKVRTLEEALERSNRILDLYAEAGGVADFKEAHRERERLIREFRTEVLEREADG